MSKRSNLWMIGLVCLIMIAAIPVTTTLSNSTDNYMLQQNDDIASEEQTGLMVMRDCDLLKHFSSYDEFKEYVGEFPNMYYYWGARIGPTLDDAAFTTTSSGEQSSPDYTGTNTQIEGIDEADFVKTNGNHIFAVHGNELIILKAFPPEEMDIVSRITLEGKPLMLLLKDDRLVLFEELIEPIGDPVCYASTYYSCTWYDYNRYTLLKVYDISMPETPVLVTNVKVTGTYIDSRIVDDDVYVIASFDIKNRSGHLTLPEIQNGDFSIQLDHEDIGYFEDSQYRKIITMVISVDIAEGEDLEYFAFILGWHSAMYVSFNSIYFAQYNYYRGDSNTTVHKIDISSDDIDYFCTAEVPGYVINQFSMDEYNGYFRIATHHFKGSNVYILDNTFHLIGSLEGLKPSETMHSARFMGERVYLVTFRRIDPFFVIDLSNPAEPKVLGELEIPGFSDYLHPYDDEHIIGIGSENRKVKISLFDVSDVKNPQESSKYVVESPYASNSIALGEHKAFTFHKPSGLLVIPVSYSEAQKNYFRGVIVLKISLENGIEYKGKISHQDDGNSTNSNQYCYGCYDSNTILRSFYIEGYIYTVSKAKVMASRMDDLQEVARIEFTNDTSSPGTVPIEVYYLEPQIPNITPVPSLVMPVNFGNAEPVSAFPTGPSTGGMGNPSSVTPFGSWVPEPVSTEQMELQTEGKGNTSPSTGILGAPLLVFVFQFLAFGLIIFSYRKHKKE